MYISYLTTKQKTKRKRYNIKTYNAHNYYMTSLQNIVISDAQGLLMLMGVEQNFDKDDQAAKHCSFVLMFCSQVKNFDPINIRRP